MEKRNKKEKKKEKKIQKQKRKKIQKFLENSVRKKSGLSATKGKMSACSRWGTKTKNIAH
jgi:hypothetical protein